MRAAVAALALAAACGGSGQAVPSGDDAATATDGGATIVDDAGPAYPPPFTLDGIVATRFGGNGMGTPNVSRTFADVDWKAGPFASVVVHADLASTCYPFEGWADDLPPTGQSWPADCDAFDRNFDVFIDDGAAAPPFEIIHAITPFGGPEHIQVDITDLANALPGAHRLRADLQSYSDPAGQSTGSNGGWTVSARVEVTPGPAPRRVLAALPLFVGRLTAGDAPPVIAFDAPTGTAGGRLEYRVSGHGQGPQDARCIGPAEEFCDRRHQLFVDGGQVEDIEPWRTDCATLCTVAHYGPAAAGFDYCQENPCGALDSVRASRANWCPGSMTPPYAWEDIPALSAPGPHTLSFQISSLGTGGFWFVSATYYAYGGP